MILTTDEFKRYGFRASTEINIYQMQNAIDEAEEFLAHCMLGGYLDTLKTLDHEDPRMKGGDVNGHHVAGYLKAVAYLAYSCLLRHNVNATAFGTVMKTDEHSQNVDPWEVGKYNEMIGRQYLRELCEAVGVKFTNFGYYTASI